MKTKYKTFPPLFKFKHYMIKKKQNELTNIAQIIKKAQSKKELLYYINNITVRDIKKIERRTVGQSSNTNWFYYRRGVITGTTTYRIVNAVKKGKENENINNAISKLYNQQLFYPAIKYGRDNEQNAIDAFTKIIRPKHHGLKIKQVGLRLDHNHPYIGGSADGEVQCLCCKNMILEVKCPFSIKDHSVKTHGHQLAYLNDKLELRKNHYYYYQIQTYLGIYGYDKAYFCIWTKKDTHIIIIEYDHQLWLNMKSNLCKYYFDFYLKHLV